MRDRLNRQPHTLSFQRARYSLPDTGRELEGLVLGVAEAEAGGTTAALSRRVGRRHITHGAEADGLVVERPARLEVDGRLLVVVLQEFATGAGDEGVEGLATVERVAPEARRLDEGPVASDERKK